MSAWLGLAIDEHDARIRILVDQRVDKGHAHGARANDEMCGFEALHLRILRCATTEVVCRDGVLGGGLDQLCHVRAADETEAEGDEKRCEVWTLLHFVLPVRDCLKINEANVLLAKKFLIDAAARGALLPVRLVGVAAVAGASA